MRWRSTSRPATNAAALSRPATELPQLRLGDDGILVLSEQRLDLLRVVEDALPLLARSRELGCVARPFELDPEPVQLLVGRVLAELLDGVEQPAELLLGDPRQWDRVDAVRETRRHA